jgi:CheY-like chemotaxis protein
VEDDASLRSLIHEVVSGAGYRVLEADSAEQAVAIARSHRDALDLVLTDVIMPGMSGRQVAEAVAQARPGTKVLYMSGYADDALGPHHVLEPGTQLLEKPFAPDVVLRKVRELLDRR